MSAFTTKDIVLAAYLQLQGHEPHLLMEGRRANFCFQHVPPQVIEDFDLCRALVEPKRLHHAVRGLAIAAARAA